MSLQNVSFCGSVSKGWLAKAIGVTFDRAYYLDPERRRETDRLCHQYVAGELADLNLFYTESNLGQIEHFSEDQVLVGGIQPNMLLGMLIGAEFLPQDAMDADISMTPLKGRDLDTLPTPKDLLNHELIKRFDTQILALQAQGRYRPIPPFFWDASGRATLHGTLTTAQKFLGEEVFIDLMTEPGPVVRVMDWIADSFVILARHFAELAGMPITGVHVGECSGCMVSAQMFADFVVPSTHRIFDALGPLRFHSCGPSSHLLSAMQSLNNLASLDLGGDTSLAQVRDLLGHNLPIDVAPMPADFAAESCDPILDWAGRMIEDNGHGPLRILYHLEPDYRLDNIRALKAFIETPNGASNQ